jgi:hypothetical protein
MSTTPPPPLPAVVPPAGETALAGVSPVGSAPEGAISDIIDLPSGKELNEVNAKSLAMSRPIRWVVVAGPVGCGKTTLLTSLYELFQWGPVADIYFAGSNTLPALEQRCHLSRMASENIVPDTQRTPYKGPVPNYVHLRICSASAPGKPMDFLFTDVSGEMFEHARDSTMECKELTFLQRAGNFLLLLDSEKGVRVDKRWAMVEEAKTLLQSCIDSKMLARDCVINIVWSKFDHFVAAVNKADHRDFREEVVRGFRAAFGHLVTHLNFGEVAARPTKAPQLGFGNGVPDLLKGWITVCPQMRDMVLFPQPPGGTRESEMFAIRHFDTTTKS